MNKEFIEKLKYEVSVGEYSTIKTEDLEKVFNYIENSISKEVIEEKLEKYKQQLKNNTKRVVQLQVLEQNKSLQQSEWEELNILFGDIEKIRGKIEALEELLKKN